MHCTRSSNRCCLSIVDPGSRSRIRPPAQTPPQSPKQAKPYPRRHKSRIPKTSNPKGPRNMNPPVTSHPHSPRQETRATANHEHPTLSESHCVRQGVHRAKESTHRTQTIPEIYSDLFILRHKAQKNANVLIIPNPSSENTQIFPY